MKAREGRAHLQAGEVGDVGHAWVARNDGGQEHGSGGRPNQPSAANTQEAQSTSLGKSPGVVTGPGPQV